MNTKRLLRKMLEIYSPSGKEEKLVDFLQPVMEGLGYHTKQDETGNLIGRIGKGSTQVLLLGHLDTVEGEIPVRKSGGNIYGRGAVDAKSALAAFIGAGSQFANSSDVEVSVVGVVEEETSSKGAYAVREDMSPDYVVVGEPSSWDGITLGYRGSIRLSYSQSVSKTHRGEKTPLPAEEAVSFFHQLRNTFDSTSSGYNSTDVRLTDIVTENEPFRDTVDMTLDIRTSTDFNREELREFIRNHGGQASVETTRHIPAVRSSKRSRLVSAFIGGIREVGGKPSFKLKTGTADMNILAETWEVPIIAYGPGDSSLDHTPDEHLELEELSRAREVLVVALNKLEESGGS
ncbi:MAG: [LysW]-lysine hydrolase [Candidatus Bipolaricaulota bacterium]|nr:[LysW]-lysine hydrolase [Candidatus Bipolaricaulota bacterium]MBS3791374.1 [LysW]-lysine hydrolase [Candidatus Bipolaricaulota bacterium]